MDEELRIDDPAEMELEEVKKSQKINEQSVQMKQGTGNEQPLALQGNKQKQELVEDNRL